MVVPLQPLPPAPPPAPDPDGPIEPPVPPVEPPSPPPGPAGTTLVLLKRADPKRVARGATVTYRLSVTNTGEAAALAVRVCDTLPGSLEVASAGAFRAAGSAWCATLGRLEPGQARTLQFVARVTSTPVLLVTNRATAQASNAPGVSAQVRIRLVAGAALPAVTG